jgi:hypothetical protein
VSALCEKYEISLSTFYKWLHLFREHKELWLGKLADIETSEKEFLKSPLFKQGFLKQFFLKFTYSFFQQHKNYAFKSGVSIAIP